MVCSVKDSNWAVRWGEEQSVSLAPGEERTVVFYTPFVSRMSIDSTTDRKLFADEYAYGCGIGKSAIYQVKTEVR